MISGFVKTCLMRLSLLSLVLLLPAISGCATMSSVMDKTTGVIETVKEVEIPLISRDAALKKKVGMVFLSKTAGADKNDVMQMLENQVAGYLSEKCSDILLVHPDESRAPAFLSSTLTMDGASEFDNRILAEYSRNNGFAACIVVSVADIKSMERKSGFVWFKKVRETARIRVRIDVYGSGTGAKILFKDHIEEIELAPGEKQLIQEGYYSQVAAVREAVEEMAKPVAKQICEAIREEPWRGFVIAVEGNRAVISAGSDVGIGVGDVYALQGIKGVVEGPDGALYRIPGTTSGELKIVSVSPNQSRGVPVDGNPAAVGDIIRIKEK